MFSVTIHDQIKEVFSIHNLLEVLSHKYMFNFTKYLLHTDLVDYIFVLYSVNMNNLTG